MLGVTRTLVMTGRINGRFFSAEGAERGSRLHAYTDDIDYGLPLVAVPDDWLGYLEAYQTFLAVVRPDYGAPDWWRSVAMDAPDYGRISTGPEAVYVERFAQSIPLGIRGRIDRVCRKIFTGPGIIDFKFGAEQAWHGEQLSFYNRLCPVGARYTVYFRSNGTYRIKQHTDPRDDVRATSDLRKAREMEAQCQTPVTATTGP